MRALCVAGGHGTGERVIMDTPPDTVNAEPDAGIDEEPSPGRIAMISTHGHVTGKPPLGATDTGGQVVYVLELSRKLASLGYRVDIWTRRFDGRPEIEIVAPGVRIVRAACGGDAFIPKETLHEKIPEWCDNALAIIRREKLAYTFINSHYWDAGVAGDLLAKRLGVKHLHTPHSLGADKRRQMTGSKAALAVYNFDTRLAEEQRLYAAADHTIATTQEMADHIVADYGTDPVKVAMIPPGYDDTRFYPIGEPARQALRTKLGYDGTVFFSLGRLARTKGFDLLIRAFAVTLKRIPDARLVLGVGGDNLSPADQKVFDELVAVAAECGVTERVTFIGAVPFADTVKHYRAADCFILSSRVEPFGMTAIEAMACGTPTVVTVHGGLYRALTFGRNALFADPFDAEDLGITMMKAVKHPRLRARLSRMGAYRARSLFTWTGIAQQLVNIADHGDADEADAFKEVEWDEPWTDTDG